MMGDGGASGYAQAFGDRRARDRRRGGRRGGRRRAAPLAPMRAQLEAGRPTRSSSSDYAVATLLEYLSFDGFSALAFQEGRSFMELGQPGDGGERDDLGRRPRPERAAVDDRLRGRRRSGASTSSAPASRPGWSTTRTPRAVTGWRRPATGCRSPTRGGRFAWNLFMAPGSSNREAMIGGHEARVCGSPASTTSTSCIRGRGS